MPAKQSKLQSDIGKVDKDQTKLKKDMDALRERIRKIQERRERWAKQAADIDREKKEWEKEEVVDLISVHAIVGGRIQLLIGIKLHKFCVSVVSHRTK